MAKNFTVVAGDDDYLVTSKGKEIFAKWSEEVTDSFSREIISAHCNNVEDVKNCLVQFRQSLQTLSMFGKKAIWLKDVNFLADSVTGRAESTKEELESIQDELAKVSPESVLLLITAYPVDRRKSFSKWLQKESNFLFVGGSKEAEANVTKIALEKAKEHHVQFSKQSLSILLAKVSNNARLAAEETTKLATYLSNDSSEITEDLVMSMVPDFGENDFFEVVEAFFALDLPWTLQAVRQHFFTNTSGRPLISSLQSRTRLLIQIRVLLDRKKISIGPRGISKNDLERAYSGYSQYFQSTTEKSNFNVFTQNPWYLSRLCQNIQKLPLKKLITFQTSFIDAFNDFLDPHKNEEEVMKQLVINCLS